MSVFNIYTDGAARGNPGPSASGFAVYDSLGKELHARSHFNGNKTNNFAEYIAVIRALEWCTENLPKLSEIDIRLYSDSELVVRQINGKYRIKMKPLLLLNQTVRELKSKFRSVSFHNLPRENEFISKVDAGLNRLLDSERARRGKV